MAASFSSSSCFKIAGWNLGSSGTSALFETSLMSARRIVVSRFNGSESGIARRESGEEMEVMISGMERGVKRVGPH